MKLQKVILGIAQWSTSDVTSPGRKSIFCFPLQSVAIVFQNPIGFATIAGTKIHKVRSFIFDGLFPLDIDGGLAVSTASINQNRPICAQSRVVPFNGLSLTFKDQNQENGT